MNTLQDYYDYINEGTFDCKSKSELGKALKKIGDILLEKKDQKNLMLCNLENQVLYINKSFEYKLDREKGTINGLSWMFSGTQTLEDGSIIPIYAPDVSKLSKSDFEYYEQRYKDCKNLYMKTEYGMMTYFGQQTVYSKRNDFKQQLCIDLIMLSKSYLEKAKQVDEKNYYSIDFFQTLKLAWNIALNSKLTTETNSLITFIFTTHQNWDITKDGTLRIIYDLSSVMSENYRLFKDKIDLIKVISKNKEVAKEIEKNSLFNAIGIIDNVLRIEQQLCISQESSLRYKAEIYEKLMIDGEENRQNALVAVKFAEDALRIYKSLNDQAKIIELETKYNQLRGKIQLTEHFLEFPKEHIEQITKQINSTIAEATENEIIYHFIITPWYLNINDIQNIAVKNSKNAVLYSMIPKSIMDKFGNTIEIFSTEEEIEEYNFWNTYDFNRQIGLRTMHQFFIESYKAKKLNYKSVIDYLETTWFNDPIVRMYHSTIVEIKPLDTLRPSLKKLFAELDLFFTNNVHQYDFVTITDSLTLKVEQILRNFCEKIGIPTFKLKDKQGNKIVMEKLLDDILVCLKHTNENPTNFDEEDRIFIKYVLSEKTGINLRNRIAHGLMDINEYTFDNIVLLFCIVMKLSKYKFSPIS
ncbi:MAG TPA: DUF4209 domain-containing protein [Bacteroidales bacterium]|nr:DUF4209 domain-containing protein [Bacteroidales bacterium]